MALKDFLTYAGLKNPVTGAPTQTQVTTAVDAYLERNPVKPGASIEEATQIEQNAEDIARLDSEAVKSINGTAPDVNGNVEIKVSGGTVSDERIAQAVEDYMVEHGSGSGQNGNGLSATASALLINILRNGVYSIDQSANITALADELAVAEPEQPEEPDTPVIPDEPDVPEEPDEPNVPEVTLTSISAVYSGGDVAVGTAVTDLTGIVVTAHYSDGSTETVTGYNLSGTIAEGSNTVTVSYGGKTTTFTVTGVAESGGETSDILYELAEPTTFDGTTYIDTGWNPLKEDQDFTIISKASLPNFVDSYGSGDTNDRAIAGAYQYVDGIYSLMIVVSNANVITVEGTSTGVYANINSVAITHVKGSGVCSVKILHKQNPDGTYGEKTGEFTYKASTKFTDTMKIGYNKRQNRYLKGTVEKFVIYSRALTDEEISAELA